MYLNREPRVELHYMNRRIKRHDSKSRMIPGTSWFKHKTPIFIRNECRSQYLLECHIGGVILAPMNSRRGWHSQNFGKGPKACARGENVSQPITGLQKVNNSQSFTVGRKKNDPFIFSGRAASRRSKACLYKVSRKYSKNWLRRTNIKSNLTPKIEYTLKPSNYDAKSWFLHCTTQKAKCARRFLKLDLEILHTCLMCPCWAFYEKKIRRKCGVPQDPNISKQYKNPRIWRERKNKIVKGLAGAH